MKTCFWTGVNKEQAYEVLRMFEPRIFGGTPDILDIVLRWCSSIEPASLYVDKLGIFATMRGVGIVYCTSDGEMVQYSPCGELELCSSEKTVERLVAILGQPNKTDVFFVGPWVYWLPRRHRWSVPRIGNDYDPVQEGKTLLYIVAEKVDDMSCKK